MEIKKEMKKVLVLCTANSCRSQMAEGYLRQFAGHQYVIYSAGIASHGIHPKAIQMMREDGIDISLQTSNVLDEYAAISFDFIITVCDYALESCPVFLQAKKGIIILFRIRQKRLAVMLKSMKSLGKSEIQ